MKKTLEQHFDFVGLSNFIVQKHGDKGETELIRSIGIVQKRISETVSDYNEKLDDIDNALCIRKENGVKVTDDNKLHFTAENEIKAREKRKALWKERKGMEFEFEPHYASNLDGHELKQSEIDILKGFVIPE